MSDTPLAPSITRRFFGPSGEARLEHIKFAETFLDYSVCWHVTIAFNDCELDVINFDPLEVYTFNEEPEANEAYREAYRAIKVGDKDRLEGWGVFIQMRKRWLEDHELKR